MDYQNGSQLSVCAPHMLGGELPNVNQDFAVPFCPLGHPPASHFIIQAQEGCTRGKHLGEWKEVAADQDCLESCQNPISLQEIPWAVEEGNIQ